MGTEVKLPVGTRVRWSQTAMPAAVALGTASFIGKVLEAHDHPGGWVEYLVLWSDGATTQGSGWQPSGNVVESAE